jgi:hypothetical protein
MPQKGEIWKVKVRRSGRIWLFKSDRLYRHHGITRHKGCVCIHSNGSESFRWFKSKDFGLNVCGDNEIDFLIKATENEIELFKKIMS